MIRPPSSLSRWPPLLPFHLVPVWILEVRLSFVGPRTTALRDVPNTVSPPRGRSDHTRRSVPRWGGEWSVIPSIDNDQVFIISIPVHHLITTVSPKNVRPVRCTPSVANLRKVQFRRHNMMPRGCRILRTLIHSKECSTVRTASTPISVTIEVGLRRMR